MGKFDFLQTIKEKRLIDEAMKYDDCAAKEFTSRLYELREKFKDNEKLSWFYTQGICLWSMIGDFIVPMWLLLNLFNEKYPHAFYISGYRNAIENHGDYNDVVLARHDEIYDALVAMDLSCATEILCEIGISEQTRTLLANALATKSKKEFLDCISQCNLRELFLKSFKAGLSNNELLKAMLRLFKSDNINDIPEDELMYGLRAISEMSAKETYNASDGGRENVGIALTWIDSMSDAIELLCMPDDERAQAYILDIEDSEKYLYKAFIPLFDSVFELSRYLYPFLNDYERESVDIMFRERQGCIKIQYNVEGKDKPEIFSLRTLLDILNARVPYDKPFEKVQANICQEEAEKCTANADADIALISTPPAENAIQSPQIGFADMYARERPPLQYSCLLKIAQELAGNGVGSSFKKKFIDLQDVLKFCWFFNEGYNEAGKPMDLTKKINWLSDGGSLRYLIMLLYGAKSNFEIATFKYKEGLKGCIVSVFEYHRPRTPKKTDLENLKRHFSDAKEASPEDKEVLIEIVSKHVPWKDEIAFK